MTIKELKEKLNEFDESLDVNFFIDPDVKIDEKMNAVAEIKKINKEHLFLDPNDWLCEGGRWKDEGDLIEDNICNIEYEYDVDDIERLDDETIQKWVNEHEQMKSVIIYLVPR